jgi:putative intracellular protease/amidase
LAAQFYETDRVPVVICHATCILLKTRLSSSSLLVDDGTWTGFAKPEELYADSFVGRSIYLFWVEDEVRKFSNTNSIVNGRF